MRAAATAEWLIDASREADTTHGTVTTMNMPAAVRVQEGHQNLQRGGNSADDICYLRPRGPKRHT